MSVWLLFVVVSIIVLAVVAMATLVVVLVRTQTPRESPGPVAAPGQADRRAAAARLLAGLDEAATRGGTTLAFARLQLPSTAPDELADAIAEARASVSALSAGLAEAGDGPAHGPAETDAAGRLTSALQRADAAARRLADAEARVQRETREIDPPPGA